MPGDQGTLDAQEIIDDLPEPGVLAFAIDKALAEKSFHEFVQQAWHVVEPETTFVDGWHIRGICSELEGVAAGKTRQLLINVPPGTMKSLLCCVFWPAWVWTNRPGKRFMFASYSDALTMRDSMKCRDVIISKWYQDRWPLDLRDDQNTKGLYQNSRSGWRMATSVGGKATGMHPDYVVADDANNAQKAESELERFAVNDWWDGTISTRGVTRGVCHVIIQQRLNVDDLTGHVLKNGTFVHICLPMEYESGRMVPTPLGFLDPRTIEGELLWPGAMPAEAVARMKADMNHSPYHIAGQLQQRPAPRGGGMFKRENFTKILSIAPNDIVARVRYWDKAGTAGGRGARSAGVLMGRRKGGSFVILDVISGRWLATDREAVIKQTAAMDGLATTIWVEQEPGSGGKESAEATIRNLAGYICKTEKVTGSKEVRAEPFSDQAQVQNVELVKAPWTHAFIEECCMFPAGSLKDQVDAASGAFNKLATPGGEWTNESLDQLAPVIKQMQSAAAQIDPAFQLPWASQELGDWELPPDTQL